MTSPSAPPLSCDGCDVTRVNGVTVHEHGCEFAWRDQVRTCKWCGDKFKPERKVQSCCSDDCTDLHCD